MNGTRIARPAPRAAAQGLSLVEMMVGLALGLLVVAGAVQVVATQARLHQAAMLEARLTHELHAAAERLHRSLRRAGSMAPTVPPPADDRLGTVATPNPYAVLTLAADREELQVAASRDAVEDGLVGAHETLGFRVADGVLQMRLGAGTWQALTDPSRIRVTRLGLELQATPVCEGARSVRHVHWSIAAEAVADRQARREVEGTTRVRNDLVGPAPCPSASGAS